jgi:hypothetical protein
VSNCTPIDNGGGFTRHPLPHINEQFVLEQFNEKCSDLVEEFQDELDRLRDSYRLTGAGAWHAIEQIIENHTPKPHWSERVDPKEHWDKKLTASRAKDRLQEWVRRAPQGKFRNNISATELRHLIQIASY